MAPPGLHAVGRALSERASKGSAGRWRAFVAATAAGVATAVVTYKALRG